MDHLQFLFLKDKELENTLRLNLARWSKMPISFFRYRHHLKQIAAKHNRMCGNPDILVPMDDDDVLKPGLDLLLDEVFQDPKVEACQWNTWCYRLLNGKEDLFVSPRKHVAANCYAIRANIATPELIKDHIAFTHADLNKVVIDDKMGLRLLHPASMYRMQRMNVLETTKLPPPSPVPLELRWAAVVMDEFYELTARLHK
jgi:hypothetical protein